MAIANDISKADTLRDKGAYDEALKIYNSVIAQNPSSFKAYIGKSIVLQKQKKFEDSLGSLQRAREIAQARGKKELVDDFIYRLFTIMNNMGELQEAVKYLNTHAERGHKDNQNEVWMHQLKNKATKKGLQIDFTAKFESIDDIPVFETVEKEIDAVVVGDDTTKTPKIEELTIDEPDAAKALPSAPDVDIAAEKRELEKKMANHDNMYPTPKDIRIDWFQSSESVTVSMFLKHLPKDEKLKVKYLSDHIDIEFPTSPSSDFVYEIGPLFSKIVPSRCSHRVFSTKLELYLAKSSDVKWKSLEKAHHEASAVGGVIDNSPEESSTLKYPNSSKKKTDWSSFTVEEDVEEPVSGDGTDAFFKTLYKDADEDRRRAMMKSFVESNGTALSTNWSEVSTKNYETTPPDGMEAKKW